METHRSGPIDAVASGVAKTWEMSSLTVQMLWRIVTGQVSAKNISGPISIAEFAGISAYLGVTAFLAFLAIISVSLGVLNLMPVPLLDGGQVVYQLVEAVKGNAAVGARPAVRAAGRDRAPGRVDESWPSITIYQDI